MGAFQGGCILYSEFTCRQGVEMILSMHQCAMARLGVPSGWLTLWRGSEPTDYLHDMMQVGDLKNEHTFRTVRFIPKRMFANHKLDCRPKRMFITIIRLYIYIYIFVLGGIL